MSSGVQISPAPTDEEAAAIVAALEAARPTVVVVPAAPPKRSTSWRFSGRWWSKPLATRRGRPFL